MVSKAELYQEIVNEEIRKVAEAAVRRHKDEMEQHCREIAASGSQEAGARTGNAYIAAVINALRSILTGGLQNTCRPDFQALRNCVPPRKELLDDWERGYQAGECPAVAAFCSLTLGLSRYPAGFTTKQWHLSFDPPSGELSVHYKLPPPSLVPTIAEYKYCKSSHIVEQWPRKETEIKALYLEAIVAITLRSLHEIFCADAAGHVQHIVFNGFVTAGPFADKEISCTLIFVRAARERFSELNLTGIEPLACLRWLGATITQHPAWTAKRR